jgi:exodeoxyribonuclease VII large subunit
MSSHFPPPGVQVLSVGQLTREIKQLLEEARGIVWVEGEVSNLARPASGHQYLTLKDEEAPLKAMLPRGVALRLRFDLRDGMRVIVKGRLTVYTPRGEYQLQIEEIQPKGIGPLELAFRQLKEKLSLKGYFEAGRKKKLPRIPRRVVLVTSPTGSAVRDILEILSRRWPVVEVWVCPVHVQGEGAAQEIASALDFLNRLGVAATPSVSLLTGEGWMAWSATLSLRKEFDRKSPPRPAQGPIDVIILGRGGGSLEDLWTFNEEVVAQAIYASRIPVVTGIGHEDDLTIADMVADRRCLTPSEAAECVVPNQVEVLNWLGTLEARLRTLLTRNLELAQSRLQALANRPCFRAPLGRLRTEEQRIDEQQQRLHRALQQRLALARQRLDGLAGRLEVVNPLAVLARQRQRLQEWQERLERAVQQRLDHARQQLQAHSARLQALSPLNVLARGYSLTRREADRAVVRQAEQVRPGDRLLTRVQRGQIVSRVEEVSSEAASPDEPGTPAS